MAAAWRRLCARRHNTSSSVAAFWHAAELLEHHTAQGIVVFIVILGAEGRIEFGNFSHRLDSPRAALVGNDVVLGFVKIVFVLDIADDLLEHVLDRHESCDAAVLVDHDCHVVAVGAKILEQHVEPF